MKYENAIDRSQQAKVVPFLEEEWNCQIEETPEEKALPYDFLIRRDGDLVAILEVKSRSRDARFFAKRGWLIDVTRIVKLRKEAYLKKVPAILGCITIDRHFLYIPVARAFELLTANKLSDAPQEWVTDDHGTKQCKRRGVVIPAQYLSEMGRF